MDNFAGNNGVLQFTGAEFTGPLHFMQFWVETVKQWETAHKKKQLIVLSATKDVQDALLANPEKAAVINGIDIRFWYYEGNDKLYAPAGGQSLAPRQQERIYKPKAVSFESVYHAVHEYRTKYPDKAILFSADGYDHFGWAVFMAGGSLPVLPAATDKKLLTAATGMKPAALPGNPAGQWALNGTNGYIVYNNTGKPVILNLVVNTNYKAQWIDPKTGRAIADEEQVKGGNQVSINCPKTDGAVLWLSRI